MSYIDSQGVVYTYGATNASVTGVTQNIYASVIIPSIISPPGVGDRNVISIGTNAFYSCSSLATINLPNSLTSIGQSAFSGCLVLSSIYNLSLTGVTSIEDSTFSGCSSLTTINLPNSLTNIGSFAFSYCSSLPSINLPNSLTTIGSYTFYNCSGLLSINLSSTNVTSIGPHTFQYCTSLATVNLPNSLTSIKLVAFFGCLSLKSIDISSTGVTSIEEYAFFGCSSLATINLSIFLTTIGTYTFYSCSSLGTINLPNSLISIGEFAFSNCSLLKSYIFLGNAPTTGSNVFDNGPSPLAAIIYYVSGKTGWTALWPTSPYTGTQLETVSTPSPPTNVVATAGNTTAELTWTTPSSGGVISYTITPYVNNTAQAPITSFSGSPYTVTGLTNGTTYTFTIFASNASGNSPASSQSNPVTPIAHIPIISYINPTSGYITGNQDITVVGSYFSGASSVTIQGNTTSFTVVNDTEITCQIPGGTLGGASVLITNGLGHNTPNSLYTYTAVNVPVVDSISPTSGSGGQTLTIYGKYFKANGQTFVTINNKNAEIKNCTDTQIICIVPSEN